MILKLVSLALLVSIPWAPQDPSAALFNEFLIALNSKDKKTLETFITKKATTEIPVATRAERLLDLASQGAPFKVEGEVKVEGETVKASVSDRQGIILDFTMTTQGKPPKMASIMVEMANRPDPSLAEWKDLASLTQTVMDKAKAPGMAIAMMREGKTETAVAGVREQGKPEKIAPKDPLSIGSIGKPICTTIIGLLIEQGKLKWDQTLKESFPDIAMKPGYEKATLEQLMHHRGGVPGDTGFTAATVKRIVGDATDPVVIRDNYAKDILSRDPIGEPGKVFQYSNAGYALLGHLAEKVAGKPYEQLVREMIYEPLVLKNSFAGNATLPKDHPVGHIPGPDGLRPMTFTGPLEILAAPAGGGMWMSVSDLVRFGQEHLNGLNGKDGLLKAETIKRLHQGEKEAEGDLLYACGWGIESFPGVETFHGHNGSNGTMRAQLCIFPKAGLVVAAIVTSGGEIGMSPSLQAALAIAGRYAKE